MSDFNGFPKETIIFFQDLKEHNNKEWFDAHKRDYENYVKRPAEDFVLSMGKKLKGLSPSIHAIPKINKSLFRINRDTRFSNDKTPYKTCMGIWFWEGERKRMECSGFYFHMEDERLLIGAGIHCFPKELLRRYRDAVVDKKHGQKLRKTVTAVSEKGYTIGIKHYKRVPRGYDESHPLAEFLLYNGLTAMVETDIPEAFYSKAILGQAYSHFQNMYPIHDWLTNSLG